MRKSEQYRLAQLAVLKTNMLDSTKLEIIKTLQADEDLAKYKEAADEKKE